MLFKILHGFAFCLFMLLFLNYYFFEVASQGKMHSERSARIQTFITNLIFFQASDVQGICYLDIFISLESGQKPKAILLASFQLTKAQLSLIFKGNPNSHFIYIHGIAWVRLKAQLGSQGDTANIQYITTRKRAQNQSSIHGQTGIPFKVRGKGFPAYGQDSLREGDLNGIYLGLVVHAL